MAKLDPAELQPLSSGMWKQDAVAFMEQCKFKEASLSFKRSQRILENLLAKGGDRYLCLIELFHIKHGLALIERFQGQDEESLKQFRKLTPEIFEAFRDLDSSQESMSNFTEVRHLLCERYVNSLERQADCSLFGQTPDYAEAADDYRRALRACGYLPEDKRDVVHLDLLYRRAAALSLLPPSVKDPELAENLCREADRIERRLRDEQNIDELPAKIRLAQAIARTLARPCDGRQLGPAADAGNDP